MTESIILGIETSCDETAAAVVKRDAAGKATICSTIVLSQTEAHALFGGVVPEIAARAHVEALDEIVRLALSRADVDLGDLSAVAATAGPGLIGGLLVGLTTAKALAFAANKPLFAINHLEGHALTARLTEGISFPYLLLLVSGGHTQVLLVEGVGHYRRLGTTIDDALGEAFDKTAKLLALPYPGGPSVEKMAREGDPRRFSLPRPLLHRRTPDFSFSGLKTAVRHAAEAALPLDRQTIADLCAAFQAAAADVVADRVAMAFQSLETPPSTLVIAGGVAANQAIRDRLDSLMAEREGSLIAPPLDLCSDNAAMIAWAAAERLALGQAGDPLDFPARARWPLDANAVPLVGHGRLGTKV